MTYSVRRSVTKEKLGKSGRTLPSHSKTSSGFWRIQQPKRERQRLRVQSEFFSFKKKKSQAKKKQKKAQETPDRSMGR
jgi:hypothetical protein